MLKHKFDRGYSLDKLGETVVHEIQQFISYTVGRAEEFTEEDND